jgi:hypothetical protein
MLTTKPFLMLCGAAVLAAVGALVHSAWATGIGVIAALGTLAVHVQQTGRAVPRSTRLLLQGGLVLLALAAAVQVWEWNAWPVENIPSNTSELLTMLQDPAWQRTQFLQEAAVATCLMLACACFGVAVGRLPRPQLHQIRRAAVPVGALTLLLVALSRLTGLFGSATNVAVVALLVVCGYALVLRGVVRRHGSAAIVVAGATVLIAAAWSAVDDARRSRLVSPDSGAFVQMGVSVSVATDPGPDIESAVIATMLLLAVAMAVLACANLSTDSSNPH